MGWGGEGRGLPSHLQEVKACGEIFQTVDLFVTLATEEVLRLLSQVTPQAVRERRRSTGEEEEERTGEERGEDKGAKRGGKGKRRGKEGRAKERIDEKRGEE